MSEPRAGVVLAHFSDVHLTVPQLGWVFRDLASKRFTGWFNLRGLGRGKRFQNAEAVVRAMIAEFRVRRPDALVFCGDATALGFASELAAAAKSLHVGDLDLPTGMAVPGNHDYYTPPAVSSGAFEREFAPWLEGVRLDDDPYPFARRVGPLWLVGVNSSTANLQPWDASGEVGAAQRERLRRLLAQIDSGPRVLVTHYPLCLADGEPETRWHGLRDLDQVVKVAADGGVCLWLHGHRHGAYRVPRPRQAPFPVICCGSATQTGRGSYGEYAIEGDRLRAVRRVFDVGTGEFRDGDKFELELKR
jgi:3',5'-cyclic AMP phosphodiesterase CpdA